MELLNGLCNDRFVTILIASGVAVEVMFATS